MRAYCFHRLFVMMILCLYHILNKLLRTISALSQNTLRFFQIDNIFCFFICHLTKFCRSSKWPSNISDNIIWPLQHPPITVGNGKFLWNMFYPLRENGSIGLWCNDSIGRKRKISQDHKVSNLRMMLRYFSEKCFCIHIKKALISYIKQINIFLLDQFQDGSSQLWNNISQTVTMSKKCTSWHIQTPSCKS